MSDVVRVMIMPGEEVVEDDFFVDLDAPLDDQDEIRFEDELVRIASASATPLPTPNSSDSAESPLTAPS